MLLLLHSLLACFALWSLLVQGLPFEDAVSQVVARDASSTLDVIRGVNIGGWLLLESYMNSDVMSGTGAVDQWTFDQTSGAAAKLQSHWSTYFTEADVAQIAAWGLNTCVSVCLPFINGAHLTILAESVFQLASGLSTTLEHHT